MTKELQVVRGSQCANQGVNFRAYILIKVKLKGEQGKTSSCVSCVDRC